MNIQPYRKAWLLWTAVGALCAASAIGVLTLAHAATGSVAYTYDPLGRITTASYDTGVCILYSYDISRRSLCGGVTTAW